jgi:uncharacterized cofD-like protein
MDRYLPTRKRWGAWRGWLTPGIGVKRWLVLLAAGSAVVGLGLGSLLVALGRQGAENGRFFRLLTLEPLPAGVGVALWVLLGTCLMALAVLRLAGTLLAPFRRPGQSLSRALQEYGSQHRGPQVVAIGGGTGLPALLHGLRYATSNITAIVTVADDGGSSGRLRQELGLIPPGDFRNNIAALARDEELMAQLLQYRFGGQLAGGQNGDAPHALQGHAFGNLLLAALTGITGSFDDALLAMGRVLAMRGRVLPSTMEDVVLVAKVADEGKGVTRVVGESAIPRSGGRIEQVALEPSGARAYPQAVQAILQANLVIVGPGSLYTSILPNLLIPGIATALRHTRALRLFVCNLATQPGETDNYTVADHVEAITRHVSEKSRDGDWADLVLANSNLSVPATAGGGRTVFVQPAGPVELPMMTADLVDESRPWRHDGEKLATAITELILQRNFQRQGG